MSETGSPAVAGKPAPPVEAQEISLTSMELDPQAIDVLPESIARRFGVFPLTVRGRTLRLAMPDVLDLVALDTVANRTGHHVEPVQVSAEQIREAINVYYGSRDVENSLQELIRVESEDHDQDEIDRQAQAANEAPVSRFVNLLIRQAIDKRASDLHLEPRKDSVSVRIRIDGVLQPLTPPTKAIYPAIVSRIKILSGMDIGERRTPQDGRCRYGSGQYDIRVSTLPTIYGEKVVMRILDQGAVNLDPARLGMREQQRKLFMRAIHRPQGMMLVTGPTGSGKTTSLYTALSLLNSVERNIITVEDPVEYEMEGINQILVRPHVGLTFAAALRSILRQDPDVVMVAEIRDVETAEIAVRAALTGHMVLSTLHTNNVLATVVRLIDMGIPAYLLGACVNLIMAQRLVRRICDQCREPYEPVPEILEELGLPPDHEYHQGAGCRVCNHTGYHGRVGVYEVLEVDDHLASLFARNASEHELAQAADAKGMITLRGDGIAKVLEKETTPEEILAKTTD